MPPVSPIESEYPVSNLIQQVGYSKVARGAGRVDLASLAGLIDWLVDLFCDLVGSNNNSFQLAFCDSLRFDGSYLICQSLLYSRFIFY